MIVRKILLAVLACIVAPVAIYAGGCSRIYGHISTIIYGAAILVFFALYAGLGLLLFSLNIVLAWIIIIFGVPNRDAKT